MIEQVQFLDAPQSHCTELCGNFVEVIFIPFSDKVGLLKGFLVQICNLNNSFSSTYCINWSSGQSTGNTSM